MTWQLNPFQGIESNGTKISFGQARSAVRAVLFATFSDPHANEENPDEDDFRSPDDTTFLRIRYDSADAVRDIEFLAGTLRYDGIDLHDHTTLENIQEHFSPKGFTFRPTEWLGDGWDCVSLGINIASHDDIGGDGDEIEWVIMSQAFKT